jgi:hypothetical protein
MKQEEKQPTTGFMLILSTKLIVVEVVEMIEVSCLFL